MKQQSDLTITLSHELLLCKESFDDFFYYAGIAITGTDEKLIKIRSYTSYCNFLFHLYSFYEGLFERDKVKFNAAKEKDLLFNMEVKKLLGRQFVSKYGTVQKIATEKIDSYTENVPLTFGEHFRLVRNKTAHVKEERAKDNNISLSEFYGQYHKYVLLLFQYASFTWTVNPEEFFWNEIEQFSTILNSDNSKNQNRILNG